MPHKVRPDDVPHPIDAHVGRKIAENRKRLGMTQTDVANAVGVTFQQLQKYERGYNRVSASRLHQIASVLGQPISAFFPVAGDAVSEDSPPLSRQSIEIARLAPRLSPHDQKTVLTLMRSLNRER